MDSGPDVLALLPAWVGYARLLLCVPTAFVASFVGTWVAARAMLPGRLRLSEMHWSERARRAHPSSFVLGMSLGFLPVFFGSFFAADNGAANALPPFVTAGAAVIAALAGLTLASTLFRRHVIGDDIGWLAQARCQLLTLVFLVPGLIVMFFLMVTVGTELGPADLACAAVGIVALALGSIYSGLPVARLLGVVRPASPRLSALVAEVASAAGHTPRVVEELDIPIWNAFALPVCNRLVFTRPALEDLDDDALRGIIAHEIGHLTESAQKAWVRAIPSLGFLAIGLLAPIGAHFGGLAIAVTWAAAMVCFFLPAKMARRCEEQADAAALAVDPDGTHYARALEILHEKNLSPAVTGRRTVHPSLYDRMRAAGVEPDFPRPDPPSSWRVAVGAMLSCTLVFGSVLVVWLSLTLVINRVSDPEQAALLRIALRGPSAQHVFALARERMAAGKYTEALTLVDAALQLRPDHHAYLAARSTLLARTDRCDEATAALERAHETAGADHVDDCRWIAQASTRTAGCSQTPPAGLASHQP